jgi:hypothetical protein
VLEAEPHIIESPRAAVYHWSVLDDLEKLGILERVSPQACANQQLIYHAKGGGDRLEEALRGLRRLSTDAEYRLQRLIYTKTLATPAD